MVLFYVVMFDVGLWSVEMIVKFNGANRMYWYFITYTLV